MAGFVAETWKDIKGNAKWDIIKWLFGGSVIATAIALVRAASLYWRMQILIFVLSVLGFAAISFYQRAQAHKRTKKALVDEEKDTAPNLVIHSAVYGTGPIDDMLVTHRLRTAVRDALVVPVDNNLVPRDPAIGKVKRLAVKYSYGNPSIQQTEQLEGERLVLPEDSEIHRLRSEVEQLKAARANMQPIESEGVPSASDPCIYVADFIDEGDLWVPASPILLENRGGAVAHAVQVLPISIGYTEVEFDCIDTIGVLEKKKAMPRVQNVNELPATMFPLLKKELEARLKAQGGEAAIEFPLTVIYKARDQQHNFETLASIEYSPLNHDVARKVKNEKKWNDWNHDAFPWREIRHTQFTKT